MRAFGVGGKARAIARQAKRSMASAVGLYLVTVCTKNRVSLERVDRGSPVEHGGTGKQSSIQTMPALPKENWERERERDKEIER